MGEKVYLNDGLTDCDQARLSVFDAAVQHGVGLFETMRAYQGKVFRLDDHLERLTNSAKDLGLVLDRDKNQFHSAIDQVLQANALTDARVRLTVTAGSVRLGIHKGAQGKPTVLITAGPMKAYPEDYYKSGMRVLISDYRVSSQDPIARHKTISYLPRLMALRAAQQAQLGEALWFTTEGHLAEGSISNIFMVKADRLQTPSLELPILPGITRKVVLQIAADEGLEVEQGRFTVSDLLAADEVFLTNSVMEVMPVSHVERHAVGSAEAGPVTRRIMQAYTRQVKQQLQLP